MTTGQRVTILGLGGMGSAMAERLANRGHRITIWNRTQATAQQLAERLRASAPTDGSDPVQIEVADDPQTASRDADVVFLSLSDETVSASVLEAASPETGCVVIDTTTTSPGYARTSIEQWHSRGIDRLECCLLGNPMQLALGTSRLVCSGDDSAFSRVEPLLRELSEQPIFLGAPGAASTLKLAFNALLGIEVAALAEVSAQAEAAGLDAAMVLGAIGRSGFASAVMAFRSGLMASGQYQPAAFRSVLMRKDLRLAIAEHSEPERTAPLLLQTEKQYDHVVESGRAEKDAAVVFERYRDLHQVG